MIHYVKEYMAHNTGLINHAAYSPSYGIKTQVYSFDT